MAVAPAPARPRPGGGRLFIIVGLLLAILAGAGVFLLGGLGGGGAIGGGNTTPIVIAKQSIPLRHQITADDLDIEKVSGGFTSVTNVYSNKSDVVNLIAEIQITKGSVITSDMLARDANSIAGNNAPAFLPLASGYVAMTIPTGEQQGVAGHISLGDYITVIASSSLTIFASGGSPAQGLQKTISKTVFTNVRIIGLGPASTNVEPAGGATTVGGTSGPSSGITSSLTIEMTQCDSEYFTWFLGNMTVRYTLESFHDYLAQPPAAPDPTCPTILSAQGVSGKQVDARYHFTAL
ncbi:MAG: RcpC/CpaB family pilus assembly protein [Candidatus Dormiibacterota bacterium]